MNDTLILFEDEGFRTLLPLVYARPTFELRCGMFTLRERVAALTGEDAQSLQLQQLTCRSCRSALESRQHRVSEHAPKSDEPTNAAC